MRGAWLCVGVVLALLVGQPVAAQPLQRVGERLLQAAAPWCGSFSDLDVQGVRRCTLRIAALQMGGAGNAHAFFTASVVADRLVEQLDDAELALVLGHEVAHIVLGHMLAGLRAAGADARALDLVATLAPLPHAGTPTAPHTLELDADALGLVFAGLAGYPLAAAPRLWRERLPALGVATAASSSHP
ncbi:MAG: M48 family metalloprotease, partial [Rubrivivax sp.]